MPYRSVVAAALALLAWAGIEPASAEAPSPPNAYVALGDSFTSGPLVLPHDTSFVPQGCGQSTTNYPHLVAAALDVAVFRDVSCGSAQTRDFAAPQTGLPLGGTNAPQYDALGPDVALVTIGIGGNDIGFGEFVTGCIRLVGPPVERPCSEELTAGGVDQVSQRIAALAPRIAEVLAEVHRRSPDARVFVVGYPVIVPDDGHACWPYIPILQPDIVYFRDKEIELNAMLAEQAAAGDATYVDTYSSSIGHDACQLPGTAWVNGAVVVPPSYPAHPNGPGLANTAADVLAAIRDSGYPQAPARPASDDAAPGPAAPAPARQAPSVPAPTPERPVQPVAASASDGQLPATGSDLGTWPALMAFAAVALLALRRSLAD